MHRNVTSEEGEGIVVSPGIMSGNTGMYRSHHPISQCIEISNATVQLYQDTRHYWDLSKHIFRYNHHYTGNRSWLAEGAHTINECEFFIILSRFTSATQHELM